MKGLQPLQELCQVRLFLEYERFAVIFLCSFSYAELYATDSEFSRHSPIFDFFQE